MRLDAMTNHPSKSVVAVCPNPEARCARWLRHAPGLAALFVMVAFSGCQFAKRPFSFTSPALSLKPAADEGLPSYPVSSVADNVSSSSSYAAAGEQFTDTKVRSVSFTDSPAGIQDAGAVKRPPSVTSGRPPQAVTIRGQSGGLPAPGTPPAFQSPPAFQPPPYGATTPSGTPTSQSQGGPLTTTGNYGATLAPGVNQVPFSNSSAVAPGSFLAPQSDLDVFDLSGSGISGYQPLERTADLDVRVQEARTGRVVMGGAVNSDLGVSGQVIIEERNFDIRRFPRNWRQIWNGRAFRGGGQNFRAELMPGSQVQRYTLNWTEPHFRDSPYSLSVGGFLYSRQFRDWTEQRLGGRVALGYEITKDLSISSELRMEDVKIFDPRVAGVQQLDDMLGSNDVYRGRVRIAHDTRDNTFMSTRGGLIEIIYDQVFGEYDYSRAQVNLNRYFLMRERADGGGRHVLATTLRLGVSGAQTPVFDNFFAGGYSTMRGFSFRGASPKVGDVQVGGTLSLLGSFEYVFPLTADEMLRGIAFLDYGTIEQDIEITGENFRVAPGFGFRVQVPALGPAPLAFDFAFPVNYADSDDRQVFSFFMGLTRS